MINHDPPTWMEHTHKSAQVSKGHMQCQDVILCRGSRARLIRVGALLKNSSPLNSKLMIMMIIHNLISLKTLKGVEL